MIKVSTVILSHLSDIQSQTEIALNSKNLVTQHVASENARRKINFVKALTLKYPNTSTEVSDNELNTLWKEVQERFGERVVS